MAGVRIRSTDMISEYQHALFNISMPDIARKKMCEMFIFSLVLHT